MAKITFQISKDYFTISETGVLDLLLDEKKIIEFEKANGKRKIELEYDNDSSLGLKFNYKEVPLTAFYIGDELNSKNLQFARLYIQFLTALENGNLADLGTLLYCSDVLSEHTTLIRYKAKSALKAIFAYNFLLDNKYDSDAFDNFLSDIQNGCVNETSKEGKLYLLSKVDCEQDWLKSFKDLNDAYLDYFLNNKTVISMVGSYYHKDAIKLIQAYFKQVDDIQVATFLEKGEIIDETALLSKLISSYCVREKDNPYDKYAIAVKLSTFDGKELTLGYLPKEIAKILKDVDIADQFEIALFSYNNILIACNFGD